MCWSLLDARKATVVLPAVEEEGIAPQVVFEIRSPGNTIALMTRKFRFYERHGVEEYYLYDPDTGELSGWQRQGTPWKRSSPWRAGAVHG